MARRARRVVRKAADRSVAMTSSHSSSVMAGERLSRATPALLTSTRTLPCRSSAAAKIGSIAVGSATSPETAKASPPASPIASTTCSASSARER